MSIAEEMPIATKYHLHGIKTLNLGKMLPMWGKIALMRGNTLQKSDIIQRWR